jgi:hypothetical protein
MPRARPLRREMPDLLAAEMECAFVGRKRARYHVDQCRFAGAILAEQDVQFTGADVEIDAVKGADACESFRDAAQDEQGLGRVRVAVDVHCILRGRRIVGRERLAPALGVRAYLAVTE